jgi:protocatechuate 3,4-dioxygenase beta subunit
MSISRRNALGAGGMVGLGALLAACGGEQRTTSTPTTVPTTQGTTATVQPQTTSSTTTADLFPDSATCTLTPEETEGPFYFDVDSIRTDIRDGREGTALRLAMRVQDRSCQPIANAVVDIWHCDAGGSYSESSDPYLRGAQVTNADGIVEFVTVYPGWYRGRAVHIHFKVHVDNSTVLTSQVFFDEAVTDAVYARQPYSNRPDRETRNEDDNIFDDRLVLTLRPEGDGYLGIMSVGLAA